MTAAAPDVGVVSKKEPRRALRVTALGLILLSRAFSKMFVSICNRRLAEARPRSDCILAVTEVAEGGGGGGGDHCRLLWQKSAFHSDVLLYFSYGRGGHDADCREEREQQRGEEKREKRSTCGAFQARGAESEAAADDDKWRRFTILFFTLLGSKRERESGVKASERDQYLAPFPPSPDYSQRGRPRAPSAKANLGGEATKSAFRDGGGDQAVIWLAPAAPSARRRPRPRPSRLLHARHFCNKNHRGTQAGGAAQGIEKDP